MTEGRQRHRRERRKSPWKEAKQAVSAIVADAFPLLVAIGISIGTDWIVRRGAAEAGPEWARVTHATLLLVDLLTAVTLVVPKALVVLNEIAGLLMIVVETLALGVRRTIVAYRTGNRMDPE